MHTTGGETPLSPGEPGGRAGTVSAAPEAPPVAARPAAVMAALVLATAAYSQLQAMVGPALPTFQREFHSGTGELAWILNGFVLSSAVATPIAGRLGDMFGRRRLLVAVMCVLAGGTVVCGLATSLPVMVLGRVLAGLGGAVIPLSFAIVSEHLPAARVGPAIGLLSAIVGVGGGAGIVAAGPVVDHLSYHWLFWLPLVLIAVAIAAVAVWIPAGDQSGRPRERIDWVGALLLGAALVALLLALTKATVWGWGSPRVAGLLLLAVALAAAWVWSGTHAAHPLIDLHTMRLRPVWTANLAAALCGATGSSSMFLLPQIASQPRQSGFGLGRDATSAGLFILPQSFTLLVAGMLAGRLCGRYGCRAVLLAGAVAAALGMGLLAGVHQHAWQVYLDSAWIGFGVGLLQASLGQLVVQSVPADQTAAAAGANTVARNIGMTVGAQQAATVLAAGTVGGLPTAGHFALACSVAAGTSALVLVVGGLVPRAEVRGTAARVASAEPR